NFIGKKMLENINKEIDVKEAHTGKKAKMEPNGKLDGRIFAYWRQIAAVGLLLVGFSIFIDYKNPTSGMATQELAEVITHPSINYLPDGSLVCLKKESRLIYPKDFP